MAKKVNGLITCCRYAYPPNSLSLCGPIDEKRNLNYYAAQEVWDAGTKEILSQFSTLFPYLSLIAYENSLKDPFDMGVVEAYWLGNSLLNKISKNSFARHLTDGIGLKKKLNFKQFKSTMDKLQFESLPHHSFHVLNIYKRTGHMDIPQTVQTMDACIINWGKVNEIRDGKIKIKTQRLKLEDDSLVWERNIERIVNAQGVKDKEAEGLNNGDFISYHWGYFCTKLSNRQVNNLKYYTDLSIKSANLN